MLNQQNLFTETINLHLNSLFELYKDERITRNFKECFQESHTANFRMKQQQNKNQKVYQHLSLSLGPCLCPLFHESNESVEKKRAGMRDRCWGGVTEREGKAFSGSRWCCPVFKIWPCSFNKLFQMYFEECASLFYFQLVPPTWEKPIFIINPDPVSKVIEINNCSVLVFFGTSSDLQLSWNKKSQAKVASQGWNSSNLRCF